MFANCCSSRGGVEKNQKNRKFKSLVTRITFQRTNSLLVSAALWDNVDLLLDLLQEDHDIDCVDSWGRTPLHAAAVSSNSKCLQVLINAGANVNKQCGERGEIKTALHLCAELGYSSNVETLLSAQSSFVIKDSNGMTAIDLARRNGHEECIKLLQNASGKKTTIFCLYE
jgi:ankyrin repeat protein